MGCERLCEAPPRCCHDGLRLCWTAAQKRELPRRKCAGLGSGVCCRLRVCCRLADMLVPCAAAVMCAMMVAPGR